MGMMLYEINPTNFYNKVNFFPTDNEEDKRLNDFCNLVFWEKYNGDINSFIKDNGLDVETNPPRDIVKIKFKNLLDFKSPIENFGTYLRILWNKVNRWLSGFFFDVYSDEENRGLNCSGAKKSEICLAKYSEAVAEDFNGMDGCYTAVKYAFWNAGIIDDYGDMPKGCAKDSIPYFDNHTDKFKKLDVKKEDLKNLGAGKIIVYTKEGKPGHIAITTGKGQEMSDCTDNMKWLEEHKEGASFCVYELTDKWNYDKKSKKLIFEDKK